ncbi:hypothetical protein TMEN_8384 [Trichophyton mentagrophytes]|nr:hypothetical protein TMEN_8384 [Trichophyton mentagrophytes]
MGKALVYPKGISNTANRYAKRVTYDLGPIHSIINAATHLDVAFVPGGDDPFPTIIPMIGQMGSYEFPSNGIDEPLDCYIHGYVSSRMMNMARATGDKGLPLCISATHVDGLVLSLSPFSHSYNYRSVVLHGYGVPVTDEDEKNYAMKLITDGVVAKRWDNSRTPPTAGEFQSTTILRVKIVAGSGKVRDGEVSDEKQDIDSMEVKEKVWSGIVPVWQTFGEPVPSSTNMVKEVPAYLKEYVSKVTEENKKHAYAAMKLPAP